MKTINVGLCRGRHEMPVEDYLFENAISDVRDIQGMTDTVLAAFDRLIEKNEVEETRTLLSVPGGSTDDVVWRFDAAVYIYATGLTVALLAAINVARVNFMEVYVMHFDAATGEYYPQRVD